MDTKSKLRLSALFVSVMMIFASLAYFISQNNSVSVYVFAALIAVSAFVGILISKTNNPDVAQFFINILEGSIGIGIDKLDSRVNERQIQDRKTEEFIKNRPVLHFLVITAIIILTGVFLVAITLQIVQLMK